MSLLTGLTHLVERDAGTWNVGARTAWLALLAPLAALAGLMGLAAVRPLFLAMTAEDGPVEWAQVITLGLIAVGTAVLGTSLWRRDLPHPAVLYGVITVGTLFVVLEEISWGQRILGLETPEALAAINRQGETNLHNILPIQVMFGFAELVVAVYAIAAALAVALLRPSTPRLFLIVPPVFLASAFAIPGAYRLARYTVMAESNQLVNRLAEIAELSLYVGILAFVLLALRRMRHETSGVPGPPATAASGTGAAP